MTMPNSDSDHALDDAAWSRLAARDAGPPALFYGVVTTGIYCRLACASRRPRRENVRFFAAPAAAEAANFRPCKRCTPASAHDGAWPAIARALAALDGAEVAPPLADLATIAGFSRAQFHRAFVRLLGTTPKRYAALARVERLRVRLAVRPAETVLDAAFASGYASAPRATRELPRLGMMPRGVRTGGAGCDLRVGSRATPLGIIVAAMTERGVCAVELDDDEARALARIAARYPQATLRRDAALDEILDALVLASVRGTAPRIPLDVAGTAFQRRVWDELARIAAGTTLTYGELAARIGRPGAARAVASACAANTVALAIPCRRVVGVAATGGYRWGPERKRRLLAAEREAADS